MTLRLPTISQFKSQMDTMSRQYDTVSKLQIQVSTGKKIQQSSDDPLLASRIQSVDDYMERLDSYDINTSLAKNRLELSSNAIEKSSNLCSKASQLILQAQSGTMNDDDREAIALQLTGILHSLMAAANTKDTDGEYIFSGFQTDTQAYLETGGTFQYQGSFDGYSIAISDQTQLLYGQSGFDVFGNIKSGNGSFSVASDTVNNTGTGVLLPVTLSGTPTMDDYTLTMVTNSSGQLAYQVVGATSGQVIPALPLLIPDDAPQYVAGTSITFNGLTTTLSGDPAVGDTFTIQQSTPQSVFQTLQNAINALNTPTTSLKDTADRNQILFEQASSLEEAFDHLVDQAADLGTRSNILTQQTDFNQERKLEQQIILTSLSDVDLVQAVSNLSLQLTSLEMTQQSYSKIQELFSELMRKQI